MDKREPPKRAPGETTFHYLQRLERYHHPLMYLHELPYAPPRVRESTEEKWSKADYPDQLRKNLNLNMSRTTFYRLRKSKKIRSKSAGGKLIQIRLSDVDKYQ
jgi:hypothetical protein